MSLSLCAGVKLLRWFIFKLAHMDNVLSTVNSFFAKGDRKPTLKDYHEFAKPEDDYVVRKKLN